MLPSVKMWRRMTRRRTREVTAMREQLIKAAADYHQAAQLMRMNGLTMVAEDYERQAQRVEQLLKRYSDEVRSET